MLSVPNKQLINFVLPEFIDRRFDQQFLHFSFVCRIQCDPDALSLHTHNILVNDVLIDQKIDISAVRWYKVGKIVLHLKLYRNLVLLHNTNKKTNTEAESCMAKK